jgi:hypothetical protein
MQRTTHTGGSGRKPPGRPQIASFAAHAQRFASHTQVQSAVEIGLIADIPLGRLPVTIITKS